jgi:threonyl-tRNA synthetase
LQRIPYLLVVGDKEVENHNVAVRTHQGKDMGVMSIDSFADRLQADVAQKSKVSST